MRFFQALGQTLQAFCRLIGLGAAHREATTADREMPRPYGVPAVAGFVMRAHADHFCLASRLASVAKLNTPNGRVPRGQTRRSAGLPPVPAERIGAKKTRLDGHRGLRMMRTAIVTTNDHSNVIAFPTKSAEDEGAVHLAQAA